MAAPDTISFSGSFARETFSLRRNQSVCSIHSNGPKSQVRNAGSRINRNLYKISVLPFEPEVDRYNGCFHYSRFIVILMGGLAVGFMSLLRLNITVAILNMVNSTRVYLEENPDGNLEEYFGAGYVEVGEFDWDNEIQQLIISYYMIAYTLPQLLTTKLAIRIGIKYSMPLSLGLCAISCLLTPIVAYFGWQYVMLLRLVNGLGASAILPLMVHVIELWMPAHESELGLAIVLTTQSILFTLSPLISGTLADLHWKWAFYGPGLVALAFCLLWALLVSDRPSNCWFISQVELDTICGCNKQHNHHHYDNQSAIANEKNAQLGETESSTIPWTRALRLKSFYALTGVWIFYQSSFGAFSFLNPSYMRQVLKVPIVENGMLCFIIQSGCMISVIWPQPILRVLRFKYNLSLTAARRVVLTIICIVAIVTWLLVARFHEYQVLLFSINRIFHLSTDTIVTGTIMSQYSHTGVGSMVYSTINAIGNLSTVFFCMAVGEFLDLTGQSVECWSWIFVAMSAMNVGLMLLFNTMISSEPVDLSKDKRTIESVESNFQPDPQY